jgi:hypothetical protein
MVNGRLRNRVALTIVAQGDAAGESTQKYPSTCHGSDAHPLQRIG